MKKEMRKLVVVIIAFGILLIYLNPVIADFELGEGNESYNIELVYGPSESVKGWINISLQDEPANSLLSAFDSNITIKEFLDENFADYSCFPADCESAYSLVGSGNSSKQFSIGYLKQKLIGIKLTQEIDSINSLSFDVSTNDGKSCQNPLEIDLLDDKVIEWKADSVSDIYSCVILNPYGCYDEDDVSEEPIEITTSSVYCEKINIPVNRGLRIGAEVIGSGDVEFEMIIDAEGYSETCNISVSEGGKIKCVIEFEGDLEEPEEAIVCITKISGSTYNIKYEDVEPCCYSLANEQEFPHDFPIFVEVGKYDDIDNFVFNQELIDNGNTGIDLADEIFNYVSIKYGGSCDSGCIIPIRIYSGVSQEITISNLDLDYTSQGLPKSESDIYYIEESEVLISSDFQKLYLEKANLLVLSEIGSADLVLRLGDAQILEQEIEIKAVPKIIYIGPNDVPALVSYPFIVLLEEERANLTYTWDFGDDTEKQITNTNIIKHAYSSLGSYELSVVVGNEFGNSSKTVQVSVGSPKDYINSTINNYNEKLNSVGSEINKLPGWIKKEIEKKIDVDDLKAQINAQESKYDAAFSDEDYIEIMGALLELEIPDSFGTSQTISPSGMIPSPEQINLDALEYFGAGGIEASEENYANSVTNWLTENLDITLESKTYALYYNDRIEDLYSYIKIILIPKQDLDEVYFLVNGNPNEIKFGDDYIIKEYGEEAAGIIYPELIETKTIEFLYPGKIEMENFPFYIAPEFRDLELEAEPGVCNFNKKCEKNLGENYKNCRSDCKPFGKTLLYLLGLFFAAFIIYIVLQEWYKRHYESHLFANKNQLFNLINFMNNSFNQGMKKSEIFDKLKDLEWNKEQLNYAWNKLQGKRTGMWEIPVFKWVEKKQVKKELEKRKSVLQTPSGRGSQKFSRLRFR